MHCTVQVYNGMVKKMAERIDPTVPGLFLVAVIALVFGFLGLEGYLDADWGLGGVAANVAMVIGVIFVVLTVSAIRIGNAFAAALFGFVAVALYVVQYGLAGFSPFLFYLIAIVFIVFVIVAFMIGAPKLLAIMLLFVALLYLFVGVFIAVALGGKDPETYALLFGIFGVLAGLVALYLSFALSTQKLPVF